ncbi:MAG: GNAT family N-acetyltransferase, partial [Octadecabacter sp.]|nr:GNAT family N-acetyltransferase [Octadecabacter sp.]
RLMPPEAEVLTLATNPADQGKGRAKTMLHAALDHLAKTGVEAVFLDVAANNAAALALYTGAGFIAFDERRNYYPDGSTAICMKVGL